MSSTLFISDLHLDSARPAVTRALASFLRAHGHCEHLYILGDLFEAWLGDDDDAPLAAEVVAMLAEFTAVSPGKSAVGPWLVTADEVPDPQALTMNARVNAKSGRAATALRCNTVLPPSSATPLTQKLFMPAR